MDQDYGAPWGKLLRAGTVFSLAVLLAVLAVGRLTGSRHLAIWRLAMIVLPIAVMLGALPFMVRGYTLTSRSLVVHRLGFDTVLPLDGLEAVSGVAHEVRRSWRLLGNGGLFSITGWFWNRRLGRYRAFATDPDRAVLLRFARGKVLVTPHDPQAFIVQARKLLVMR